MVVYTSRRVRGRRIRRFAAGVGEPLKAQIRGGHDEGHKALTFRRPLADTATSELPAIRRQGNEQAHQTGL